MSSDLKKLDYDLKMEDMITKAEYFAENKVKKGAFFRAREWMQKKKAQGFSGLVDLVIQDYCEENNFLYGTLNHDITADAAHAVFYGRG